MPKIIIIGQCLTKLYLKNNEIV